MFKDIKILILAIFIILSLAVSILLFALRTSDTNTRLSEEDRLTKVRASKDRVNEEFSRAEQDIDGIKGNIERLKREASSLESELAARKKKTASAKVRLGETDRENIKANQKIEKTVLNIDELRNRIANVVRDTLQMREELVLLEKTKTALESRFRQYADAAAPIETGYAKDKIVPEPEEEKPAVTNIVSKEAASKPEIEGEVLTVNREFDFIVVSLGKKDGITEGMVFDVLRDGTVLGQVEIETVRTNISAASLINIEAIAQMRAGDIVHPAFSG